MTKKRNRNDAEQARPRKRAKIQPQAPTSNPNTGPVFQRKGTPIRDVETLQKIRTKSFAEFEEKAKLECYLPEKNGGWRLDEINLGSHYLATWTCNGCPHEFEMMFQEVRRGNWCPYCAHKRLCGSIDCKWCEARSLKAFLSPEQIQAFHPTLNGTLGLHQIVHGSTDPVFWICFKPGCLHVLQLSPMRVAQGHWCNYCAHRALCENEDCQTCFKKSLASFAFPSNITWCKEKNQETPRAIFKSSQASHWFHCSRCNHDFFRPPAHLTQKHRSGKELCSFCLNLKLCTDNDCKFCWSNSFASVQLLEHIIWNDAINQATARQVFKNSARIAHFDCKKCCHRFHRMVERMHTKRECPRCRSRAPRPCLDLDCKMCKRCSICLIEKDLFKPERCPIQGCGNFDLEVGLAVAMIEGKLVCQKHWIVHPDRPRTTSVRMEHLFLQLLQERALATQEFLHFAQPSTWDCAVWPGLSFRPDVSYCFLGAHLLEKAGTGCRLRIDEMDTVLILEVNEVSMKHHDNVKKRHGVSDAERERQIRSIFPAKVAVAFVYVVLAAQYDPGAHENDVFFTKSKQGYYGIARDRFDALDERIVDTLETLEKLRESRASETVVLGH